MQKRETSPAIVSHDRLLADANAILAWVAEGCIGEAPPMHPILEQASADIKKDIDRKKRAKGRTRRRPRNPVYVFQCMHPHCNMDSCSICMWRELDEDRSHLYMDRYCNIPRCGACLEMLSPQQLLDHQRVIREREQDQDLETQIRNEQIAARRAAFADMGLPYKRAPRWWEVSHITERTEI